MMSKNPKQRPPSAAAVAKRLQAFATEEAIAEIAQAVRTIQLEPREPRNDRNAGQSPHLQDTLTFEDDPLGELDGEGRSSSQGTSPIHAPTDETTPQQTPAYIPVSPAPMDAEAEEVNSGLNRLVMASIGLAGAAMLAAVGVLIWEWWG